MVSSSFSEKIELELTSADVSGSLAEAVAKGISLEHVRIIGDLTVHIVIPAGDYRKLEKICISRGERLQVVGKRGAVNILKRVAGRRILLLGIAALVFLTLFLPTRILFFRVEGNTRVPQQQILDALNSSGVGFGASRREIRSERVKNALLASLPQLQWAGVNTKGCVAIVSVRERVPEAEISQPSEFGHIVAVRDGIITQCTVLRGSSACVPGQAVTAGEVLISGYTDCGICIRAEQAQGEVYARTRRHLGAKIPSDIFQTEDISGEKKKISILVGKKRINLWKDSGIWDTTCGRMYEEYYITLPGGFVLPVAIVLERYTLRRVEQVQLPADDAENILSEFCEGYLHRQMLAGKIDSAEETYTQLPGCVHVAGEYVCTEMIGKMQRSQIGDKNGENN